MSRVAQLSPHWGEAGDEVVVIGEEEASRFDENAPSALAVIGAKRGIGGAGQRAWPVNGLKLRPHDIRMTRPAPPSLGSRHKVTLVTKQNCHKTVLYPRVHHQ